MGEGLMRFASIFLLAAGLMVSQGLWAQAAPSHSGHGGGSGSSEDGACVKARISRFKPDHLESVPPGAEFQFTVSGSNGPGHIHVTIRQEPVPVTVEDKETFYVVKAKLPPEIKNQAVRISIKAKAKNSKCDADAGILLKVTE